MPGCLVCVWGWGGVGDIDQTEVFPIDPEQQLVFKKSNQIDRYILRVIDSLKLPHGYHVIFYGSIY